MKRFILLPVALLSLIGLSACTDNEGAVRHLENLGFTNIETTGYRPFACSEDDFFRTGFRAVSPVTGDIVAGTVCSGVFKGSTVRFD